MDPSIHYVNREAYLWYIVWRTCFYEDHSAYLPKFHAPIHALYHRYNEFSLRFHLAVDELSPQMFVEEIQKLRETQNIFLSCYWDIVPSTKRKRRKKKDGTFTKVTPKDPIMCCVTNSDWACKYERLLYSSIRKGGQEFKIVNGKPIFGTKDKEEEEEERKDKEEEEEDEKEVMEGKCLSGITFDTGETLVVEEERKRMNTVPRTEEYKETLDWLQKMDEKFGDTFVIHTEGEVGESASVGGAVPTFDTGMQDWIRKTEPKKSAAVEITVVISRKIAQLHASIEKDSIVRQIEAFTYPPLST